MRPGEFGKLKEFVHLIGSRNRDPSACSVVPQLLRYRVPPPPARDFLVFLISWVGVRMSPVSSSAILWTIVPSPSDR
jgi:hypothetical protein